MSPILGGIGGVSVRGFGHFQNLYFSSFDSITSTTVGAGGVASVTFSSIPQTYTHLQIRSMTRSAGAGGDYNLVASFNGDTTAGNYPQHYVLSFGSGTPTAGYSPSDGNIAVGRATGAATASNIFGVGVADILDYRNTNKFKTVRIASGRDINGSGIILFTSGAWRNTNAITSITFSTGGGNLAEHTSIALYGIKV